MRKIILAMIAVGAVAVAQAQDVSGSAHGTDGDTLNMTGIVIRLHGIDAPEYKQGCTRGGVSWACGREAADKLSALVEGKPVRCEHRDTDDYGRTVATCRVGQIDLSAAMVDAGLAVALPNFTTAYVANEARARDARIGIWGGEFQMPADYRKANPTPRLSPAPPVTRFAPPSPARPSGVYYRNCKEAWAAGAAPFRRGEPGYRPEMDGDGDGIACEPYRQR